MALIQCEACGYEVSDRASACPKCGHPITAVAATGRPLTTVQETSKPLKFQIILSWLIIVGGLIGLFVEPVTASVVLTLGILWRVLTKIRVWWHHK